jgi:DNA-binding CsgD family transcriptional regulator
VPTCGPSRGDPLTDPIAIVETAYSLVGDEREWLSRLGETVRLNLDGCIAVRVQTYDATRSDLVTIRTTADCGVDERMVAAEVDMRSHVALRESEQKAMVPILRAGFVGSLRSAPAALGRAGLDEARVREFERNLEQFLRKWGHADQWWVNAQDPTGIGCLFMAPLRVHGGQHPRELHRWHCIAAHVATAFRIRRQLTARPPADGAVAPTLEAILEPNGGLRHAEEPAQGNAARTSLVSAARALDRARGPLRKRDPGEAVAIWQALVAGRWSLVDHFDSDGRRFVLAHRNDPSVPDTRGLTVRERQVLAYASLGHSNKVTGYELGLSTSTVAFHLARARAKLHLPSAAAFRGAGSKRPTK